MKYLNGCRVKVVAEPMWGFVKKTDDFGFIHVACDDGFMHRYKESQIEAA